MIGGSCELIADQPCRKPRILGYDAWMNRTNSYESRRQLESQNADQLGSYQLSKLNELLATILPTNRFYTEKFSNFSGKVGSLEEFSALPFTFKEELMGGGKDGDLAANLTFPIDQYSRFHRTSGTRGRPMIVVDTPEGWEWWIQTWQFVLDAAKIEQSDRVMMAFSFGPFVGFWSANDALAARGAMVIPGGGLSSIARLELMRTSGATALCCTPSYALHLAEVAIENQIDIQQLNVRVIIVAGEPGGSVPAIRTKIEETWDATVIDHSGATEIGPWGYGTTDGSGLHIVESEFLAEFISVESGQPGGEMELSELVLTTLGRFCTPVIRYKTGDLVRPTWNREGSNRFVFLEGGVLGRVDDMMIIRGVNVFPSSVEQILRSFPEIVEYRMTAYRTSEMDALRVEVEDRLNQPDRVAKELKLRLGLSVDVQCVPSGTLPRFEAKGRRFVDQRADSLTNGTSRHD